MPTRRLNTKKLAEIETSLATRCPIMGLLALDGWTWRTDQNDLMSNELAIMCSKWHCGSCNECGRGLGQSAKQMTENQR